jgi:hypothetical protein
MSINWEELLILGLIGLFISFVVGANWWSIRDANKMLDRLYGRQDK